MRELTKRVVVLGVILSAVLAGANAYLGLKVGMTVSASIPAAVCSMAILRALRHATILENNLVQTAASSGEALAAGVIFTMPALILLGYWESFHYLEVTVIALLGGIMGVLFSIPLRRAFILESGLNFPEGVATAAVLRAGDIGGGGVKRIALATLAGGTVKFAQTGWKALAGSVSGSLSAGRAIVPLGCDLSPALLGVGYIVGLRIAVLVFAGGAISWLVAIPWYSAVRGVPEAETGYQAAFLLWNTKIRYLGVGAMVIGGVWAVVSMAGSVQRGIRSSLRSFRARAQGAKELDRAERDIPFPYIVGALIVMVVPLALTYWLLVPEETLQLNARMLATVVVAGVLLAVVAGFLFSAVGGYMAGLVGSSHNPISGITIATILLSALVFSSLLGVTEPSRSVAGAALAIMVGAVACCAAAISGDNLQDLKAGHLVGATPYRQQTLQCVGVLSAALVMAPVLALLYEAYGIGGRFPRPGMDPAEALAAPQATMMQSVAEGVFARALEWPMIGIGALVALLVIFLDQALKSRGSSFRTPVLAVAVGIYLPIELTTPILLGGLAAHWSLRSRRDGQPDVLLASGLIAGEALIGILLAIPFALAQSTDVLALLPAGVSPWVTPSLIGFAGVMVWLIRSR